MNSTAKARPKTRKAQIDRDGPDSERRRRSPHAASLRWFAAAATGTLLAAGIAPLASSPALAATAGVSAVDPQTGYPTWYSDGEVKLQFCYFAGAGCLSEPPNPNAPASYPDNFPEEAFWFNAEASDGNLGLYEAALEGAHANGVVRDGEQMGFGRLRFILDNLEPGASYTITHPYGVNTFVAEQDPQNAALGRIKETIDAGVCAPTPSAPCDWAGVGAAFLGDNAGTATSTFLKQVGAAPGTLGDITTARPVTGAPTGNNFVRVDGPDAGGPGVDTLTVSTFTVQGLIFNGADDAPSTPDLTAVSDSGRSATDNITKVTAPTFAGTVPGLGASETTVELLLDGAATPAATTTTVNGAYSVAVESPLASGVHRVQARTPNPAYTVDPVTGAPTDATVPQYLTSGTLTFTVDTVAPSTSIVAPFPSNPSADTTPTLHFTSTEERVSFECQLDPSNLDWDANCASPKVYDEQLNGTYIFNVRATDPAGNLGSTASRTWTIGPADTVAPTLTAQSPASGADGVPTLNTVTARFSERVRNVDSTTFVLQDPTGAIVPATVTLDSTTNQAVLDPTSPLAGSSRYTVSLKNTIADLSGNLFAGATWTFTTVDTAPPTVTARSPLSDAVEVSTVGNITATFNEAVQGVSGATFALVDAAGGTVAATVSYNATTRVATLDPSAQLAPGSRFTATLTGGSTAVRDLAGNPLDTSSWSFTTGAASDTTAPTLTTRTPAVSGTGVSTTGNVSATFSEAVTGVSGSTFTLRNAAGTAIGAAVTYNATTRVATLDPTATLPADTRYTVTVTGGASAVRDLANNALATTSWTFTTGPVPTVTGRTPGVNGTAASTTADITATLSEAVTGVSGTTFTLRNAAGSTIAATVSYNATTRVATLNPGATLASDTRYTATLTGGTTAIRDTAGNPLATQSWTFTTGPAPTIVFRSPGINASGVSRAANVAVDFSEPMSGVSTSTVVLRNSAGTAIPATLFYNTTTRRVTVNPSSDLAANTVYRVTLTGGTTAIRDVAGNPLATTTWSFTTGP